MIRPYFPILAALLAFSWCHQLPAQVSYVRLANNGAQTLRLINPDGSGDTAFGLPFPSVFTPTWSRDGAFLAVTSVDPARSSQLTLNAWTVNLATGAILNVTNFEDKRDEQGNYSFARAVYKAFSPNRALMAINSYIRSGGGPNNAAPTTTPILQLFPTNGDPGPIATLHVGDIRDEVHHDGEGVDWSPRENFIVAPFKWGAPLQSGTTATYGPAEATALFLIDPNSGNTGQLTVPRGDVIFSGSFVSGVWAEQDYAPKFSPNGAAVAYVRSYQQANTGSVPELGIQSLRIIDLSNGSDRQVIQFQKGLYVSAVDWSPDGTQLVFDLGQQAAPGGFPVQAVQPNTVGVYLVGIDGSNPHQLVAPAAGTPAWKPAVAAQPASLANISTRMNVGNDPNQLIGGFIISGSEPKKVIILATGPSLAAFGLQGVLADPVLELYQGNTLIASNDNWKIPAQAEIEATQLQPTHDLESALVRTLAPGAYTANVRGTNGTGVGTVQVYDLAQNAQSKLANISSRGFVQPGDDKAMIAGFIIGGNARVVVRALGPSLSAFGIPQLVPDPTLELKNANGTTLIGNDDWQQSQDQAEISNRNLAPGDARESALAISLPNGGYTAIVRGKGSVSGVAVVEVYNVQ